MSLWWTCTEVSRPGHGLAPVDVLAPNAARAAGDAATAWAERMEDEGSIGFGFDVDVAPQADDARDDPHRVYEGAGGGGKFRVDVRRTWVVRDVARRS